MSQALQMLGFIAFMSHSDFLSFYPLIFCPVQQSFNNPIWILTFGGTRWQMVVGQNIRENIFEILFIPL